LGNGVFKEKLLNSLLHGGRCLQFSNKKLKPFPPVEFPNEKFLLEGPFPPFGGIKGFKTLPPGLRKLRKWSLRRMPCLLPN